MASWLQSALDGDSVRPVMSAAGGVGPQGAVVRSGPPVTLPRTVAVVTEHVAFKVECIDRVYLNVWVSGLVRSGGAARFCTPHRGYQFAPPR